MDHKGESPGWQSIQIAREFKCQSQRDKMQILFSKVEKKKNAAEIIQTLSAERGTLSSQL